MKRKGQKLLLIKQSGDTKVTGREIADRLKEMGVPIGKKDNDDKST